MVYCSTAMGVPARTQGTMFTPVPLELMYHEPERVGGLIVDHRTLMLPITQCLRELPAVIMFLRLHMQIYATFLIS